MILHCAYAPRFLYSLIRQRIARLSSPLCCCSVSKSCLTLCDPMGCSKPSFQVHHQLLEFAETHVYQVMPSNHLIFCHPLLLLPSVFPSIGSFGSTSWLLQITLQRTCECRHLLQILILFPLYKYLVVGPLIVW